MNKYLRTWMLGSPIPWLRDIATRSVRKTHAKRHAEHQRKVYEILYPDGGTPRVLNGPFAGMHYLNEPVWGSITPRWIGSYESCLWPVVEEIVGRDYRRVIDVGCAEGFYAVGLARALPQGEVLAFDLDRDSRAQVLKLWQLNGQPGKLSVHGLLDHRELTRLGTPGSLLVCDIEGGEMELLDPAACPALSRLDILVEVHQLGAVTPAANAVTLTRRFESTHEIVQVDESSRATSFAHVEPLDPELRRKAMSEGRPYPQLWLWMKARDR
jgi:SAM-dependent methyltransferase